MDKTALLQQVLAQLQHLHDIAREAAQTAYETATDEQNIAENKYDTLGLEASYLATGQARRAEELRLALATWKQLVLRPFAPEAGIQLGALVCLADAEDRHQWLFLGPEGAPMKLQQDGQSVQVIGPQAPLGRALLGKACGDEVNIAVGQLRHRYEVLQVE